MYVFVMKDDLMGVLLVESRSLCYRRTCSGINGPMDTDFSGPEFWVSDSVSHIITDMLTEMAFTYPINHLMTFSYCPWTNGTLERINRDILKALRVLIAEFLICTYYEWKSQSI